MKRSAWMLLVLIAAWAQGATAQQAEPLNDKQLLGRNLFAQSCVVCHMKTQVTTGGHYGPPLSRSSLEPEQIDAIVAYLKTLPTP